MKLSKKMLATFVASAVMAGPCLVMTTTSSVAAPTLPKNITAAAPSTTVIDASSNQFLGYEAPAGPILRKKYGFRTERLGVIPNGPNRGVCYQYGWASPDGKWYEGSLPDLSGKAEWQVSYINNKHRTQYITSKRTAAYVKVATNLAISAEFRSDWKTTYRPWLLKKDSVAVKKAEALLKEAQTYAGPVKAKLDFIKESVPGGTGTAKLVVTANGKTYPYATVAKPVMTGAKISKVTKRGGVITVSFTQTSIVDPSLSTTVSTPEWRIAGYSVPTKGGKKKQHLVNAAKKNMYKVVVKGSFGTKLTTKVVSDCSPKCDGTAPVAWTPKMGTVHTKCEARVSVKAQGKDVRTGKVVSRLDTKSAKTAKFTGNDLVRYTFWCSAETSKNKWSTYKKVGSYTVDCPPWVNAQIMFDCDCDSKGVVPVTAVFHPVKSTRLYNVTLNGVTKTLAKTGDTKITLNVKVGETVKLGFTTGNTSHTLRTLTVTS